MAYEWIASPNYAPGRNQAIKYIVIHHWDDPAKQPTIQGVINHFKNPAIEVSAHYVVSGDRIVQMVKESDTAWHARQANPYTIGIEIDPNVPGNTYKTVGSLVRDIRTRYGIGLPLKKHSDFNQTSCPGNLDLARIDREANNNPAPQPTGGDNTVFENDAQIQAFYFVLRGREASPTEVAGWRGKKMLDFVTNQYAKKEVENREAEKNNYKAQADRVPGLESEVTSLKSQLQDRPASTQPDPDGEEYRKLKQSVKRILA
jgi:hypothetical protein